MKLGAIALISLTACSGSHGPSDEAIARYAGTTPPSTATSAPAAVPSEAKRLAITVEKGTGPDMDPGPGTSDFYVTLAYEGQRFRTSVIEGSEAPVWGDSTVFEARSGGVLEVALIDEDSLSSDEKLGIQTMVLPPFAVGETQTLEVAFKGERAGTVTLTVTGLRAP